MTSADPDGDLAAADAAYRTRAWRAAAEGYAAVDARSAALPAGALERWATASFLTGEDQVADAARERAHHAHLAAGDVEGALRVGHWLGVSLVLRGEPARAGGWFARLQSLIVERGLSESKWQLYLDVSDGMRTLFGGDASAAVDTFRRLVSAADAFADPDLTALTRNGLGQSLIAVGRLDEGLRRLDEVMATCTTSEEASPEIVGLMYCAVIDTCRRCFDLRRAAEWTAALSRWCARQPDLQPYRGQCLVHRSEVLTLHGCWPDAQAEVDAVFRRLGEEPTDPAAAMAFYQRGELHRLRGEVAAAEAAYRRALLCGRDPQPGLALLRLQTGDVAVAFAALRRAVEEDRPKHDRARLLPAYVEVATAADDLAAARSALDELTAFGGPHDPAPLLVASSQLAAGRVALADGDHRAALRSLRDAVDSWRELGAPYEAAVSQVLIAQACAALGDSDTAALERAAARWTFEKLGAAPDLAALAAPAPVPEDRAGSLTAREAEILRQVATGATNRAIAGELFLSDKTVARHIANIFLKLGVKTRAAATAYAFEHRIV